MSGSRFARVDQAGRYRVHDQTMCKIPGTSVSHLNRCGLQEFFGWLIRVVVLSGALVAAVEVTWYPSDADPGVARQAYRLIWVRSLKSRDRPWLKQSTIEILSQSSCDLQSCTGWLWAARSAALTRALASSLRISSPKTTCRP